MSEANPSSEQSQSTSNVKNAKPRSRVEKMVVRGLIGLLLLAALLQGFAYLGYAQSQKRIKEAIGAAELGEAEPITLDKAEQMMFLTVPPMWTKSDIKSNLEAGLQMGERYSYVVYNWQGVILNYRILLNVETVNEGEAPMVLSYATNTDTPEQ